jgi:hypothetical protein
MSNCCLKYTDWLNDLIINRNNIQFTPTLNYLIQPFDVKYSGIWRPLTSNQKIIQSESSQYLIPYNINPGMSGLQEYISNLIGYKNFIKFNNPTFNSWLVTEGVVYPTVDIGMSYDNAKYYFRKNNRANTGPSIQKKKNSFSTQTINVIRNKLNDEAIAKESLLSVNGSIPRIEGAIVKTEVIARGKTFGLEAKNNQLLSMFSPSISDKLNWTFSGNLEYFKYLSTNEYLSLDYTMFTEKTFPGETTPRKGQYSVRVYMFGQNDLSPPTIIADTGPTDIDLSETDIPYAKGFITIKDEDLSQEIYVLVKDVTIGGSLEGSRSTIEDIKNMLVFNTSTTRNSTTKQMPIEWSFNGGQENFAFLKEGSNLTLTYDLYIYDNLGQYTSYKKTITIIGKNEPPGIGIYDVLDSSGGVYDLNNPEITPNGTLSFSDIDYNDSINTSVISVSLKYSTLGAGNNPYNSFLSMLSASVSNNRIIWQFNPNTGFLQYLGGGQIVEANYVIKATDSGRGNGYAVVSISIIGKNEQVQTSLPDIDTTINLPPITALTPPAPTSNIRFEQEFSIQDANTSDTVGISILYHSYTHENVLDQEIPQDLDISRMLYFIPVQPKNTSNTNGTYKLIFDSAPESFRYLNASNKKAILYYQVIVTDIYGSYKLKNIKITVIGSNDTQNPETNPKDTSIKFADYTWGWYRYYDVGRRSDDRHIPGVDFYFGDVDTFLFYGEPEFLVPQTETVNLPSGYNFVDPSGDGTYKLIIKNNADDIITSKNLDSFFSNAYEKSGVLALLKTHPYIDLVTHNLTDIDAFRYTRDNYGRILPLVSGLSNKEYNSFGKKKFVSKTQDIAYRLADKYGLRMVAKTNQPIKLTSKFQSCTGPNIGIQQHNKIYHKTGSTKFSFMDVGVTVGQDSNKIKYDKQISKSADNTASIIQLNRNLMDTSPIISYAPCTHPITNNEPLGVVDDFGSELYVQNLTTYSGYNIYNFYYNIVDYRLNNELFHQEYIINNLSGNYSGVNKHFGTVRSGDDSIRLFTDINSDLIIDFHGHGGIKDRCLDVMYASGTDKSNFGTQPGGRYDYIPGNIFFDPLYIAENSESIETTPRYITLNYYANIDSEGEIGNINIEYLRSPNKPLCRSFINEQKKDIITTTPNNFRYDFRNNYYISSAYVPSVTTYYIPPSGFYYANHFAEDKAKIGIHLENHPNPRTPLTKTHNLSIINPLQKHSGDRYDFSSIINPLNAIYPTKLFTLSYNGSFNFKYNLQHLPAGKIYLYCVAPSGSFTLSLLPHGGTTTISSVASGIDKTLYLDFDPNTSNKARIQVAMYNDCDNWSVRLSHEPFDYLRLPLISKLETDTNMGFFHPNSGWLNSISYPKYLYKTPIAPYAPSPLENHQDKLEKQKKIRTDHYFWYDAEKMYSEQYLDGTNFIIDTSGMKKPLVDLIDKSKYVAFQPQGVTDYYWATPDFYTFRYTEEDSPIKQSIQMSYLHMDSSYWYPFNDFVYSLVDPRIKNKIAVYSLSDNKRCFSYFDDTIYNRETILLTNHETINIDNQIVLIEQTIETINGLIIKTQVQIQDFYQQINDISNNITISQFDKQRAILKITQIITSLSTHITSLNNNIGLLEQRRGELESRRNSFFTSQIVSSSGNNDNQSLILTLSRPLPDYLWGGGFIKKNIQSDKHQSYLLYRSNITRNDPEIKVGKWGNIIAGKDVSEYNNSSLRQKKWNQSSLFFNFNPNGIIASSGYYFPFSYTANNYNISGSKIYSVIPNKYNEQYDFEDYGLISAVSCRLHSYIYAGPYQGDVFISRAPKRQLVQFPGGQYITCSIPPSGISEYTIHNLRGGDLVKIQKTSSKQTNMNCVKLNTQYYVLNGNLTPTECYIGSSPSTTIACKLDPDPYTNDNIFILDNIYPKFNSNFTCLGKIIIKHNGQDVSQYHVQKPKTPIYYELDYQYNNIFPYLSLVLPYHLINMDREANNNHLTVYDKFLGNIDGTFFTYVNDPSARDREGLIRSTRYSIYNHNDAQITNNYSNIVGDDSPLQKIKNPASPASLKSLLPEYISNNKLLDTIINSLELQINNILNTISTLQNNLIDTSLNQIQKNKYIENINQLNNKINILSQRIGDLNGQRSQNTPPTYTNWDKLPRSTNINFSPDKYKAKNQFIDMNIFGDSSANPKYKPTLVNGNPAVSGYVYFEGLVEPPLSDIYERMITPYNGYKIWIDIPKNARWGLMHKNGKVFWQNTIYSIQKTFETNCDTNAQMCDSQKPQNSQICGTLRLSNGANELFNILKMDPLLFEIQSISLPVQCNALNFCCSNINEIESANVSRYGYGYLDFSDNKLSQLEMCQKSQTNSIKLCNENYYPINIGNFINLWCFDNNCPQSSGSGGYPVGSLSGTNYGKESDIGGTIVPMLSGRAYIQGQSLDMFKIRSPIDITTFINQSTKKITFIDTDSESLYSPNTRVDNIIFNHKNENNVYFSGVGYLTVESGNKNPEWIQKYCSYAELIEPNTYSFKSINEDNSKFIDLKANSSGLIWQNEQLYRDFIPHSGCFYGFMGEYDINSHKNNNPFYKAELNINAILLKQKWKNITYSSDPGIQLLCQQIKDLKNDRVFPGPLYEVEILDGNNTHRIIVSLLRENDRFVTQFNMTINNQNSKTIKIEHTPNSWDYLLYKTASNCESAPTPFQDKTILNNCYNAKQVFVLDNLKKTFANCKTNKCPDFFHYCSDEDVAFTRVYGKTTSIYGINNPPPKCPPNGIVATNTEWKIEDKTYKLGRSRESCERYIAENPDRYFSHSFHPKNHFYHQFHYSAWMCFPEPKYTESSYYPPQMSFKINIYHNLLEIILPEISTGNWSDVHQNKHKFYAPRNSVKSLFPIVKVYVRNQDLSVDGIYAINYNQKNYLGEIIFSDD